MDTKNCEKCEAKPTQTSFESVVHFQYSEGDQCQPWPAMYTKNCEKHEARPTQTSLEGVVQSQHCEGDTSQWCTQKTVKRVQPNLPRQALRAWSSFSTVAIYASHYQRCTQGTVSSVQPNLPIQVLRVWSSLSTVSAATTSDIQKNCEKCEAKPTQKSFEGVVQSQHSEGDRCQPRPALYNTKKLSKVWSQAYQDKLWLNWGCGPVSAQST